MPQDTSNFQFNSFNINKIYMKLNFEINNIEFIFNLLLCMYVHQQKLKLTQITHNIYYNFSQILIDHQYKCIIVSYYDILHPIKYNKIEKPMKKITLTQTIQSHNQQQLRNTSLVNPSLKSTFVQRMSTLKKNKFSIVNQHIKVHIKKLKEQSMNRPSFEMKLNNSMQLPLMQMKHERAISSITSNNFLMHFVTPKNKPSQPSHSVSKQPSSIRSRQKSTSSQVSRTSNLNPNPSYKTRAEQQSAVLHQQLMRRVGCRLDQDRLQKRLSAFSKEQGKNAIRIYKDDIHKIIVSRYSKDRITTFLDTQYIQDYNSILKTMKQLVTLKKQQMLTFSFLIFDQNKDGLITADDLTSLLGIKKQSMPTFNPLLMSDILKINKYIESAKNEGDSVLDQCTHPILKDQCLTFMKYRISNYRSKKNTNRSITKQNSFLSCRMHQHLYTLQDSHQSQEMSQVNKQEQHLQMENIFMAMIRSNKRAKSGEFYIGQNKKFAINFDRFCQIYQYQIPKVFLDFLYVLGGIVVPGQSYLPVDTSILFRAPQIVVKSTIEQDKMKLTFQRIAAMSQFKKQFKIFKLKTIN